MKSTGIQAGRLRHRVAIQRKVYSQNATTGEMVLTWRTVATVWAAIDPISAREFIQSQAIQSEIVARVTIRHMDGVEPAMRIVHQRISRPDVIYDIHGVLADTDSGLEYLTLPVSAGLSDG